VFILDLLVLTTKKVCAHAHRECDRNLSVVNVRAHAQFSVGFDGMTGGQPERVAAWAALLRVYAAVVPKLEREVAAKHMPLSWYDVLLELDAAPDRRLRMSELGARVVLSRERVSRVVDELERAGLTRREPNPDDKRSSFAVITDDGRRRRRAAAPTYLAGIALHYTDHLSDEEITVITTALNRVLEAEEGRGDRR
jgi:DNA-binding MarR family transcriptional regulator